MVSPSSPHDPRARDQTQGLLHAWQALNPELHFSLCLILLSRFIAWFLLGSSWYSLLNFSFSGRQSHLSSERTRLGTRVVSDKTPGSHGREQRRKEWNFCCSTRFLCLSALGRPHVVEITTSEQLGLGRATPRATPHRRRKGQTKPAFGDSHR